MILLVPVDAFDEVVEGAIVAFTCGLLVVFVGTLDVVCNGGLSLVNAFVVAFLEAK